jgi:hypothetical protein
MLFLKTSLGDKLKRASITELLSQRLSGPEPARSHKVVHVSMLTREDGFCPREFALLDACGQSLPHEYVSMPRRVAFDTGNALADLVRNKWLADDVVGDWVCALCKSVSRFCKRPKAPCQICKANRWLYSEPRFVDPASNVVGSIDLFIDVGLGKHSLVEVKTIDKDAFSDLAGPYAEHRIRTQVYLRLIERSGSPYADRINTEYGIVLYISKGYGKKVGGVITPFKEFTVQADPEAADKMFESGEALFQFRAGGPMPEGICPNSFVRRAKSCPVIKQCFSGQYPAGKPV